MRFEGIFSAADGTQHFAVPQESGEVVGPFLQQLLELLDRAAELRVVLIVDRAAKNMVERDRLA